MSTQANSIRTWADSYAARYGIDLDSRLAELNASYPGDQSGLCWEGQDIGTPREIAAALDTRESSLRSVDALEQAQALAARGAIFYVSHSGGKDSQAMYAAVSRIVPADQIVVIHADLGDVEWDGVKDHIADNITHHLNIVWAIDKDGDRKDLLGSVQQRAQRRPDTPAWFSSSARWCTSDFKRGPIEKFIRNDLKARGKLLAVNCMGLRAEESSARAHRVALTDNSRLSKASREVYDWLPVHTWSTAEVFDQITAAGQLPHYAYDYDPEHRIAYGNDRLSCVFCIFGSQSDLEHGARERPELAARYTRVEREIGHTMFHKDSLADRIGHLIPTTTIEGEG